MASTVFDPAHGGDPVLFQHLLWLLGHFEVYPVLILFCVAAFFTLRFTVKFVTRKSYGRLALLWAGVLAVICGLWFLVSRLQAAIIAGTAPAPESGAVKEAWVLYPPLTDVPAPAPTLLQTLMGNPALVWISTLILIGLAAFAGFILRRKLSIVSAAGVFVAAAIVIAIVGGVTSLMLSRSGGDVFHDTYYVVAQFRYFMVWAAASLIFACVYWALPKIFAMSFRPVLAWIQAGLWVLGFGFLTQAPLFWSANGLPDRYVDETAGFSVAQPFNSAGYIVTLISLAVFAICLLEAVYRRLRSKRDIDLKS